MHISCSRLGTLVLSSFLIFPGLALAQQAVGIVTALKGKAQLTRAATQTALSFKDNLILRDVIDTQERSLARILFGGKSSVTVRELSRLEVREEILPTGAVRSIHDLSSGAILVNVAPRLLRPGDEVQIRTPNAVAAVRGTSIFTECTPRLDPRLFQCNFTVLAGSAIITPQGLPPITLAANTSVNITSTSATRVQAGQVEAVTPAQSAQIQAESQVEPAVKEEANRQENVQAQSEQATQLAMAVVQAITGQAPATSEESQELATAQVQASEGQTVESFAQDEAPQLSQPVKDQIDNPAFRSRLIAGGASFK